MTNDALVAVYLYAFWPVLFWGCIYSLWKRDWCIMRAVVLTASGQLALELMGVPGNAYYHYAVMFGVTAFLSVVRPAGFFLGVYGAVNIAGFILAVIGALKNWTEATNHLIWICFLVVSWLEIIVIMGGTGGGVARRVYDYFRGRLGGVFVSPRRSGASR